jgi:hypothetical protein
MFTTKIDRPCSKIGAISLTGRSLDQYEQMDSNSISKNRFGKFKQVLRPHLMYIYIYICICIYTHIYIYTTTTD